MFCSVQFCFVLFLLSDRSKKKKHKGRTGVILPEVCSWHGGTQSWMLMCLRKSARYLSENTRITQSYNPRVAFRTWCLQSSCDWECLSEPKYTGCISAIFENVTLFRSAVCVCHRLRRDGKCVCVTPDSLGCKEKAVCVCYSRLFSHHQMFSVSILRNVSGRIPPCKNLSDKDEDEAFLVLRIYMKKKTKETM